MKDIDGGTRMKESGEGGHRLDLWAVVELFGHQKIAGRVTEEMIAGAPLLRVDVPTVAGAQAFTRYYGASAIYSLTPTSEEVARACVGRLRVEPITVWVPELQPRPALPSGGDDADEDVTDWDEDEGR